MSVCVGTKSGPWRHLYVFGPSSFNITTICRYIKGGRIFEPSRRFLSIPRGRILTYGSFACLGPKSCTIERYTVFGVPPTEVRVTSLPAKWLKSEKFVFFGTHPYAAVL